MESWHRFVAQAVKELYPTAIFFEDWNWAHDTATNQMFMITWNEAKLGVFDIDTLRDKAVEIENRPAIVPVKAVVVALAELQVADYEVNGVDTSVGIGAAMAVDENIIWLFFAEPEVDANYLAFVQSPGFYVDVTDRQADYFEITVTDRVTNAPAMPTSLSISIQRVK